VLLLASWHAVAAGLSGGLRASGGQAVAACFLERWEHSKIAQFCLKRHLMAVLGHVNLAANGRLVLLAHICSGAVSNVALPSPCDVSARSG